jgi:hypothetical protein
MNYNIEGFIELVENHAFVEAHEVLEDDWNALKKIGDKKSAKFLQALINGATSLALHVKGRPQACEKVWGALQRNKHLVDEVSINNKEDYIYIISLLENYYNNKEELLNVA